MEVQDFQIQSSFILRIILMFGFSQGLQDYIMKPYFEKHESLDESEFGRFLDNEIHLKSCPNLPTKLDNEPKVLALHRNLIGEGSHRQLMTSITLELEQFGHSFEVIVVERLPSGVFADPFELQRFILRGVLKDAAVFGDTNLELPSFRSNRSLVEVHVEISPGMHSRDELQLEVKIELPLHARYQLIRSALKEIVVGEFYVDVSSFWVKSLGLGYSRVEFGEPNVMLRYRIEENLHKKTCLLVSTDQKANSQDGRIVWEVPCGYKEHAKMVSVVTFSSAVLSALLIVLTSVSYSNLAIACDLKQS